MSAQPIWEFVTNLGDKDIINHGGFLVYHDTTGVYPPEAEVYEPNEDEGTGGTMYRFCLDPPRFKTYQGTNTVGPMVWHNEWFVNELPDVACSCGQSSHFYLLRGLLSKDPVKRAMAYRDIVGHFGCFEFDQYPVTLTEDEAQERYSNVK